MKFKSSPLGAQYWFSSEIPCFHFPFFFTEMAESFAFQLANQVLGKLGLIALQEVVLVWGVNDDLEDLKNTISTIQAVILDAEEQKSNNHQIGDWLRKLKNALYDADDVIDEIEYEALRRKVAKSGSTGKKVRSLFSTSTPLAFRFKMGHKMKNLRERFDKIAADRSKFNITERVIVVESNMGNRKREMTHSYVDVSNIIGRDLEKEIILSMLMQPSNDEQENVSVIPIIGIGGMGKTALAKLVFNDERVIEHFDQRMWVCVSDDFETEKLTKKILVSATKESAPDLPLDELQTQLRNELDNRRYLLVLDDVWNDDREKWLKLKELLVGGADGSKIVVTTRKKSVASVMGTLPPQELKGLSHQDCMSLFVKCAFIDGEGKHYSNLVKLGDEIVKKCGGVPLAVRALGCFLFGKVDEHVWASMRDNEIWKSKEDRILPVLKLSYDELPACLKQCFVFCSLFPKGFEFFNHELIQFWLAHGLIQPSGRNEDLEDIGNEYVTELCSRSFFQDVEDLKGMVSFKMHDLVHDLAQSVAQFDHYTANDAKKLHSSEVHHVSCHGPEEVLTLAQKIDKIRTIMFPYKDGWATGGKSFVSTCASRFKCIRYLDLSDSDFEALASSIGKMKHLRFLTLSRNKRIKKLPASICKLYHLHTLMLDGSGELEELPSDMGNL